MKGAGTFETAVGAVVIAVAALFLAYAYRASGENLERGAYRLSANFGRVDGVTVGADVRIAGVKIGTVVAPTLDTDTYEAKLSLLIARGVPVPEDSIAKIVTDGLLGGSHVSIEPGASDVMLADGESITITQGAVDLLGLAVEAFTSGSGSNDDKDKEESPEADSPGGPRP